MAASLVDRWREGDYQPTVIKKSATAEAWIEWAIVADSAGWRKWCEENPEKCAYQPKGGKREKGEPLRQVGTFTRMPPVQVEQEIFDRDTAVGVDAERVMRRLEDRRKFGMTNDVWISTEGARVEFDDRTKVTDAKKQEVLETIDELMASQPHPTAGTNVKVIVEDYKGVAQTFGAAGVSSRGATTMLLAPYALKPAGQQNFDRHVAAGTFMPAGAGVSNTRYTMTHEYGHMLDRASGRRVGTVRALEEIRAGSKYGQSDQPYQQLSGIRSAKKDGSEAFAESFAEWHLSGGTTKDPLAIALAKSEGWKATGVKAPLRQRAKR